MVETLSGLLPWGCFGVARQGICPPLSKRRSSWLLRSHADTGRDVPKLLTAPCAASCAPASARPLPGLLVPPLAKIHFYSIGRVGEFPGRQLEDGLTPVTKGKR